MTENRKVLITPRALLQRLGRALAKQDQKIRALRGRWQTNGDFMVVDVNTNAVVDFYDLHQLPALARELGVLAAFEDIGD